MMSASLSVLDPALIDGFRSKLAEDFAQRIFDIIPEISECIEFEAEACTNGAGKKRFQRAAQLLYSRRRDLQSQTAAIVCRIFDERLFRLVDGVAPSGRLSLDSMSLLADDRLEVRPDTVGPLDLGRAVSVRGVGGPEDLRLRVVARDHERRDVFERDVHPDPAGPGDAPVEEPLPVLLVGDEQGGFGDRGKRRIAAVVEAGAVLHREDRWAERL